GTTASGGTSADAGPPDASADAGFDASPPLDGEAPGSDGGGGAGPDCARDAGAAGGELLWQQHYPGAFADHLEVDARGHAIVAGSLFGPLTLGTFDLDTNGSADVHLARFAPDGAVEQAAHFGGTSEDYALNLALGGDGRILLAGVYNGAGSAGGTAFPTFAGTAGRYDGFLVSLGSAFDHRWSVAFPSTGESSLGLGLAEDSSGSAWGAGFFRGSVTLGGESHVSAGAGDAFLARFDEPAGSVAVKIVLGGTGEEGAGVTRWDGARVRAAFDFSGTLALPGHTALASRGGRDIAVLTLARDGTIERVTQLGGPGDELLIDAVLRGSSLVLTGTTNGASLELRPGEDLAPLGGDDVLVASVAADGAVDWARRFGGTANDRPREIAAGPCGELVLVGEFRESMTLGGVHTATPPSGGGATLIDAFVVKARGDFEPVWVRTYGGAAADRALGAGVAPDGRVVFSLAFQSTVDLGGGPLAPGPGWSSAVASLSP
ncbi:MAG: hypothetical protein FJ104_10520, partial [Deltaproteobacteria bacterium]|nr:hypothetical protein [Deltaproteobacteria bacterium]